MSKAVRKSPACLSQKFKPRFVETKLPVIGEIASTPVYCRREPELPLPSKKRTSSLGQGGGTLKSPPKPPLAYRRAAEFSNHSAAVHSAAVGATATLLISSFRPGPIVELIDTFFM